MLLELNISDFALIDNIRLDLEKGLNVLTGETGAGKSIIIDAVNMVLGERADTDIVRTGAEKAMVEAFFVWEGIEGFDEILQQMGLEPEQDKTLVLGREIRAGRSVSRINGRPVPLSRIRMLSRHMIDIHGQHQHQSLLDVSNHIEVLDQFGGPGLLEQREKTASTYEKLFKLRKRLREIETDEKERERDLGLFSYQIDEIKRAELEVDEEEELIRRRDILANAEKIFQGMAQSYQLLYGEENITAPGVVDGLGQAAQLIFPFVDMDKKICDFHSAIESSCIMLKETLREMEVYLDSFEINPKQLNMIEERLSLINELKRKYGDTIEEILEYCQQKMKGLEKLKSSQRDQDELVREIEETVSRLKKECNALSGLRKKAAILLAKKITAEITKLGMVNGAFEVCMKQTKDFTAKGTDTVEFMFSANLGEPLKPLSKIVSGGEMSRIMLAIKTNLADIDSIPTLIFDEIDAGISGRTAQVVAQLLANVAKKHQVLCVTHLPQIAAMADNHYLISKEEKDGHTHTKLKLLKKEDRILELARLLSGTKITELTIKHSEEMLRMAKDLKNSAV